MRISRLRFIAPIVAALLFALGPVAAFPPGLEVADFRGSDSEVLLSAPGIQISEADLFVYAVVTRLLDPVLAANWDAEDMSDLNREKIRTALELYAQLLTIAQDNGPVTDPELILLQEKARRLQAHPAAQIVWADEVVRDLIYVFPEDILYYFMENKEEFSPAESVLIRRLRVPFGESLNLQEREALQARAEELRREAGIAGGLEAILRREPGLLLDPPGKLLEVTREDESIDPLIRTEAFRLGLLQVSAPIRTSGGYVLIEAIERNTPEPREIENVVSEIEEALRAKFLPQQFDYILTKAIVKSLATNRALLYQFLPGDADIYRVRDFALTVDEFNALYPEIVGDPERPNKAAIFAVLFDLVVGEVVTQELERKNLLVGNDFYRRALELSDKIFIGATYVREKQKEIEPTDQDVRDYIEENRATIVPSSAKKVWSFTLSVRDPGRLSRSEIDTVSILMRGYMDRMLEQAKRQFRERRAIASDRALSDPEAVLDNLPRPRDNRVKIDFEQVGTYTSLTSLDQLGVPFDDLVLGEFTTPIELRDGRVVTYFVSAETEEPIVDEDELFETARARLLIDRALAAFRARIDEWKTNGDLKYAPELQTAAEKAATGE